VGLNSVDNFKGIAELLNVRDLVISCSGTAPQQGIMDTLWSSIAKLICCKLRALTFPSFPANLPPPIVGLDRLAISHAEHHLEVLEVSSTLFPQVPSWIGRHCSRLSVLSLTVNILRQDDVDLLVQLPNLLDLKLNIRKCPKERILINSSRVAFPALKLFTFSCFAPCLFFAAGALPNLHTLTLNHHGRGLENVKVLEGIQHLLNLKEVHVVFTNGYCGGKAMPGMTEADAQASYRDAISMHPGKSGIKILVNLFCLVMPSSAFYYDSDDGAFVESQ
jgi:disease resistance protein RPM1